MLLKLLASYLVAVLLLQGVAAASAWGAGPLHRHHAAPTATATAAVLFVHADPHSHRHPGHHHAADQRHHHAAGDGTVALDAAAQEAADIAALALTVALSLLAVQTPRVQADSRRHVLRAAALWFWHTVPTLPLMRPPASRLIAV